MLTTGGILLHLRISLPKLSLLVTQALWCTRQATTRSRKSAETSSSGHSIVGACVCVCVLCFCTQFHEIYSYARASKHAGLELQEESVHMQISIVPTKIKTFMESVHAAEWQVPCDHLEHWR